jgi:hypothetical protein
MAGNRLLFNAQAFPILENIILNAEGGKYFRIIRDRDSAKNMEKLQVWTEVTQLFNQVPTQFSRAHYRVCVYRVGVCTEYLYALGSYLNALRIPISLP